MAAVAEAVRARVIVTFIDNNNWDTGLANCLPVRVVCIANGWRHPNHIANKCFDVYLSISAFPASPASTFNFFAREHIACGHLKMGLYLESRRNTTGAARTEPLLLWISQYRPERNFAETGPDYREMQRQKHQVQGLAAAHLARYAAEKGCRSLVMLSAHNKGHNRSDEIAYYQEWSPMRPDYSAMSNAEWNSYDQIGQATLVAGVFSTLLFESLGAGKRTLFVIPVTRSLLYRYVGETVPIERLSRIAVFGESYEEFAGKCEEIIGYSEEEYESILSDLRADVVCINPADRPQDQIRRKLSDILAGS